MKGIEISRIRGERKRRKKGWKDRIKKKKRRN